MIGFVSGCGRESPSLRVVSPDPASKPGATPTATTQIVITRSELNSGALRVEGNGAVPNHAVTVDGGAASGTSDGAGAFRIQKSPYSSSTCRVTVTDGASTAQATLSGCTATAPPPPPPPPPGPTAPTPLSPAAGASVLEPFTISWSAVTTAKGLLAYNWQVSLTSTFATIARNNSTMGPTSDVVSGLAPGAYFWRVQAVDSTLTQGAWSAARAVTITGTAPGAIAAPVLNPPKGYNTFHPLEAATFTWSAVPGAVSYVFDANTDPTFPVLSTIHLNNIPTPTMTLAFADQGSYVARVFAVDAAGNASAPSNTTPFSVFYNNPLPAPPTPIAPLGGVAATLPVRLSWTDVPNPQDIGYEIQISGSSTFGTIEDDEPNLTPPFRDIVNLTAGTKFWRVRSFQGAASPLTSAVTAWSTPGSFTIAAAPPAVTGITLVTSSPFSGDAFSGQVQLAAAAPAGGTVVTLASSNPAALSVPASVSFPAGFAIEPFNFTAGQVTVAMPVTITATVGTSSTSAALTVQPPSLKSLSAPSVLTAGTPIGAIVFLNGLAPPAGAVVSLSSSSPAATPPASVTVAASQPTLSFQIPTTAVSVSTPVTLTASWNGAIATANVTLSPSQPPATISISPATTVGNTGSNGVVTIAAPQTVDLQLALSSSNPAVAFTNNFVTIPAGVTAGGFLVFTQPPATPTTVTISVTGAGVTKSAPITVNPFPAAPLTAPALLSPADGTRFAQGASVTFDWSDVSGAANYSIQVSTSSTFGTTVVNQTTAASTFATATLPVANLFWRARANAAGGTAGAWSATRSLRVK
jgi:hypothetical protein